MRFTLWCVDSGEKDGESGDYGDVSLGPMRAPEKLDEMMVVISATSDW